MFDTQVTEKAAEGPIEIVETGGRLLSSIEALHPLDDPAEWERVIAYDPPAGVDIEADQKWLNDLMGLTRDNQPIYKLVWNGDRRYWHEFYNQWNAYGEPTSEIMRRPRVRWKGIRDPNTREFIRDIFPPRWLVLTRLEPEQYADSWREESYTYDSVFQGYRMVGNEMRAEYKQVNKQIRPNVPPPVFWTFYTTVARHSNFCCATAEKEKHLCFGKYTTVRGIREQLEIQRANDLAAGNKSPFEKVGKGFIEANDDINNGYKLEMEELQVESEIYVENPMALLGIVGSMKAGIDDPKRARQLVEDHYKKRIDEQAKLL